MYCVFNNLKAKDKDQIVSQFSTFVKNAVSEQEEIAHKLLGEQFEVSQS